MKTKTLIIPDVHYKFDRADKIIKAEGADRVVFSGDIFDPKGTMDGLGIARDTAEWYAANADKYDFVEGNHDAPYKRGEDNFYLSCSGYTSKKAEIIRGIVKHEHWKRMKRYHWVDGWLVTHAGLSNQHFKAKSTSQEDVTAWLDKEIADSEIAAKKGENHWIYGVGASRGGFNDVGGINWCDWDDEFQPVKGLRQIMGHTYHNVPQFKLDSICADTMLLHYTVMIDGDPQIKKYADL